ncbi:hypothetical protein [Flavobacterium yafengii]|uniref:hypothetical protein n=1 Tax=Flavobacterium yafengii TaxID=3041253 RepID=UPI0024A980A7|nr:hypothetical protein [Flavobacterium yafengii]MDI5897824.1 hypothetical protein [Flavobacterium yafengii]MDI6048012.1 hypothetical protein [Flavobacterium yafengii]
MNESLKQILFHEIGHYISIELNHKIFKRGYGVEKINLILTNLNDDSSISFGETISKNPKGYKEFDEIKKPAEFIATTVYGCVFETLFFEKVNFYYCFNGGDDYSGKKDFEIYQQLITNKYSSDISDKLISYIVNNYISGMKSNECNHLQKFNQLDFNDVLLKNDMGYLIDLEKLEIKLIDFINEHSKNYKKFVEKIKTIIEFQ